MAVNLSRFGLRAALGAFLFCIPLRAENNANVERVILKGGALFVVQAGATLPMTNEITLSHDIKVSTNGTFRVKDGKPRPLTEGQALGVDGMLTSPDGVVAPVFDHIAFVKGKVMMVKDGERSALADNLNLPDGVRK